MIEQLRNFIMDDLISPAAAITYLKDAAAYFVNRDTKGEDSAFWANVQNAENCRRIARLIEAMSPDELSEPAWCGHCGGTCKCDD